MRNNVRSRRATAKRGFYYLPGYDPYTSTEITDLFGPLQQVMPSHDWYGFTSFNSAEVREDGHENNVRVRSDVECGKCKFPEVFCVCVETDYEWLRYGARDIPFESKKNMWEAYAEGKDIWTPHELIKTRERFFRMCNTQQRRSGNDN